LIFLNLINVMIIFKKANYFDDCKILFCIVEIYLEPLWLVYL
jgi:hypothetical protein